MKNLKFRRQFLFTRQKSDKFLDWKKEEIGDYFLYAHPDNELNRVCKRDIDITLIGFFINPHFPDRSNKEILEDLSSNKSIDAISRSLYSLVGRFVLIIKIQDNFTFFHDTCGLKSIFYTKQNCGFYAASQPLLLKKVTKIKKDKKFKEYKESEYKKNAREHWIPCGSSLYEDVYQLVPNHYLNVSDYKQIRFWPVRQLQKKELDKSVTDFSKILKNTLIAANNRFDIALPVTSGWDSRILLSACKDIAKGIYFYTYLYRNLNEDSYDIKIPKKMLSELGLEHHIIDTKKTLNKSFAKVYTENSDMAHLDDWGYIANGIINQFPQGKTAVKANCAEIGRCVFYDLVEWNPDISTSEGFLNLGAHWEDIDFAKDQIQLWFDDIERSKINLGYNLLDLFYWEQRMGSWQAQAQLEWDIIHESFTPFNNRELIDIMLAVDPKYRKKHNYLFFTKVMEYLWKDVLDIPIKPVSMSIRIKRSIKKWLIYLGIK